MTNDDIIRLAREAGVAYGSDEKPLASVTRFFHLAYAAGAAAEREECAKLCADLWEDDGTAYDCQQAIRARSQQ